MSPDDMDSQIVIPVTPFISSLFKECKENLKYGDKSNTDFLIFLLNSSMHIFSIVKEFSPILQDALGNNNVVDDQLLGLEKKSSELTSSPYKFHNDDADDTNEDKEDDGGSSVVSLPLNSISEHFTTYDSEKVSCDHCLSSFANKYNLLRHQRTSSCSVHFNHPPPIADRDGEDILCPDCGKGFTSSANLSRHMKCSKICGTSDVLSTSLPIKLPGGSSKPYSLLEFECSFCQTPFSSKKSYNQHKSKQRCRKLCKFCDYTANRGIYILNHITKEHGTAMSLEDIEAYTTKKIEEHFEKEREARGINGVVKRKSGSPALKLKRKSGSPSLHPLLKMAKLSNKINHDAVEGERKPEINCKHCDYTATSQQQLSGHMNVHAVKKPKI